MTRQYPFGAQAHLLTEAQLRAQLTVDRGNDEFVRRLIAMMDWAQDHGHPNLGIATVWRNPVGDGREWLTRYTEFGPVRPTKPPLTLKQTAPTLYASLYHRWETAKKWDPNKPFVTDAQLAAIGLFTRPPAQWYTLNAGEIGLATPYNSLHADMPPDAIKDDTGACAADMYREIAYMLTIAHLFGLRTFEHVPGESHHVQPIEYPSNRADYNPVVHKLTVIQLPGDEMREAKIVFVEGDSLRLAVTPALTAYHIRNRINPDGTPMLVVPGMRQAGFVSDADAEMVPRSSYAGLELRTPIVYEPNDPTPQNMRTVVGDFLPPYKP